MWCKILLRNWCRWIALHLGPLDPLYAGPFQPEKLLHVPNLSPGSQKIYNNWHRHGREIHSFHRHWKTHKIHHFLYSINKLSIIRCPNHKRICNKPQEQTAVEKTDQGPTSKEANKGTSDDIYINRSYLKTKKILCCGLKNLPKAYRWDQFNSYEIIQ